MMYCVGHFFRGLLQIPRSIVHAAVAGGLLVVTMPGWAAKPSTAALSAPGIMARHDCMQCHRTENASSAALLTLGPSFRQVARRYRLDKMAEERLVKKILQGGNGQWGVNNMPPQAISEDDTRAVVRWILKLK